MLRIDALSKVYTDGTVALDGLSLELEPGMFGLLGPNGAGKTTFLSMLALELEPTGGRIFVDGLAAHEPRNRREIRHRIGYLPQFFGPIPYLSGREYLRHCARLRGVGGSSRALDGVVDRLLDAVGLAGAAGRRSGDYSGGMKRRLGLAQALVHSPPLVIVDEPTAGLDPEERIRFRNLVADVSTDTTVLLSTHIVEDVEATCPRLGVIAGGRLRFDGPPSELLRRLAGRLWEVPPDNALPPGAVPLGIRVAGGVEVRVVAHEGELPNAAGRIPDLEDGYGFLLGGCAATRSLEGATAEAPAR